MEACVGEQFPQATARTGNLANEMDISYRSIEVSRVKRSRPLPLQLEELEPRLAPAAPVGTLESFDTTTPSSLPAGWTQWSSTGTNAFAVQSGTALSQPNSLAVNSPSASGMNARTWLNSTQP